MKNGMVTEKPKALLFFIHGYGDRTSRWAVMAKMLAQKGIEWVSIDQRNFGHSEGNHRGVIDDFEASVEDQITFLK